MSFGRRSNEWKLRTRAGSAVPRTALRPQIQRSNASAVAHRDAEIATAKRAAVARHGPRGPFRFAGTEQPATGTGQEPPQSWNGKDGLFDD